MIRKHSISLHGHRTSFSIEDEFMAVIRTMAEVRALSIAELVAEIDERRTDGENLSSALRIAALAWVMAEKGASV